MGFSTKATLLIPPGLTHYAVQFGDLTRSILPCVEIFRWPAHASR